MSKNKAVYLFLAPSIILFLIFSVYTILFSFVLGFGSYHQSFQFVGLENFIRVFKDPLMWKSLYNIVIILLVTIPIQIMLGLIIATILSNKVIKNKELYRTIFYIPTVTSTVAITFVFSSMFNPTGLINKMLELVGLAPIEWLTDPFWARIAIMIVIIWKGIGYYVTLFLSGLANIPEDIYEAANIDGASTVQKFFKITIPQLRHIILFTVIISTINGLNTFDVPNILFNGTYGPNASAITPGQYMYSAAFTRFDFGSASAVAWLLVVIAGVLAIIQFKIGGENE